MIAASLLGGTPPTDGQPEYLAPLPPLLDQYVYEEPRSGSWYVRGGLGLATAREEDSPSGDIDYDDGWAATVGVGQRIGATNTGIGFSVELDALYTSQDADDATPATGVQGQDAALLMLDGILDYRIMDRVSIFGGAGVGLAWLDVDTDSGFQDEDGPFFAWQAKAGVAWHFTPTTSLSLGYRFADVDDEEIDGPGSNFDIDTRLHIIEAGLMFGI